MIDKLINEPEQIEKILKDSNFTSESLRKDLDDYLEWTKEYFFNNFYKIGYNVVEDKEYYTFQKSNEPLKKRKIIIKSKKNNSKLFLYFWKTDNKWILNFFSYSENTFVPPVIR